MYFISLEKLNFLIFVGNMFGSPVKFMSYQLDCILQDISGTVPYIYSRILWNFIIALIIIFIYLLLNLILKKLGKMKTKFYLIFFNAIVFLFINLHPNLLEILGRTLACRSISS